MFSCVWLYFKKCLGKYFLMFGCVLENTIENTFSTCYSHFLTFSRLPNDYIISLIPQNTNKTQKKLIGEIVIGEIAIGAIAIDAIVIGAVGTSRDRDRDQRVRAMRRSRSREDQSGDCDQCYRTSR